MKVLHEHQDGTRTVTYDPNDRVRFINPYKGAICYAEAGDLGTVIRIDKAQPGCESIAFLDVQTDRMKADNWGSLHVPPWYVEFVA